MVSPFRRYERPPTPASPDDELIALVAEAERRGLNIGPTVALAGTPEELAEGIKRKLASAPTGLGAQQRTATPEQLLEERLGLRPSNPFERYVRDPIARFGNAARNILPKADPTDVPNMADGINPLEAVSLPFASFLPRSFETEAPEPLQPTARLVRSVVSPGGIVTLPFGGPRVVGGGLLGAAGGATAGQAIGGDTGELIGAIGGGVAGGIPAVQRLAGRGATAVGRGAVRGGDEAAFRLQGRQLAHAATQPPPPGGGAPPISQGPAAGPPVAAAPPFAPTGAVSQAAVTSPPVATPPRSVSPAQAFDPYGLSEPPEPLSRLDRIQNAMREVSLEHGGPGVIADPKVTPIMRDRGRIIRVGESQSDLAANAVATEIKRGGFQFDEQGRIPALANIDPENPSGPILSSLAARLPLYEKNLAPQQLDALKAIRDTLEPYRASLSRVGVEVGSRPDIVEGGFYIPRTADLSGDIRSQVFANRRPGTGGYRKTARFEQAEQGLASGVDYLAPEEAVRGYVKSLSKDVANARAANQIKALGAGSTPADRIDHALQLDVEKLRSSISGRIQTLARQTSRAGAEYRAANEAAGSAQTAEATLGELADLPIDKAVDELGKSLGLSRAQVNRKEIRESLYEWARSYRKDVAGVNADPYAATPAGQALERARGELRVLERLNTKFGKARTATSGRVDRVTTRATQGLEKSAQTAVQRYAGTAARSTETADELESLRTQLEGLSGRWEQAKKLAEQTPRGSSLTSLPGLQKLALPTRMADAIETVLEQEKPSAGGFEKTIGQARRIMQAGMTTLDNSAPGIQGLLLAYRNPKAFGVGMKANVRIWLGRPDVVRAAISDSDAVAAARGLPTAKELARYGLNLSEGGASVYDVSAPAKIRNLPVINRAQRAFEGFGLPARLRHSYDVIEEEIASGRTLDEIVSSGDMQKITASANRITGIADTPFGGGPGQAVLFAARFLQARMANVANGVMGLRSFELHDVVPMLPQQLNVRVGFKTPLAQRQARRAMFRMIGFGVGLTFAANEAQGHETDFRPVVNGRWNSNFLKIRVANRDVSVFGPYDSLLRLIVGSGAGVATGRPGEAISAGRGLTAPHVSLAWDLISGETAVGEPVPKITELRTEDMPKLGGRLAESFTPISASNLPTNIKDTVNAAKEGKPAEAATDAATAAFELHGGKSAPLSFTDEADRVSKSLYGKGWSELNDARQKVVRDRMYHRDAPEVMLRSAEKDFAEYKLRRLNTQGVNMLRSALKKLVYARDAKVVARAKEILKDLEAQERERKRAAARR